MNLRDLRKNAGLTLKQLEARSGVGFSAISEYECGKRQPRPEVRRALEAVLGPFDLPEKTDKLTEKLIGLTVKEMEEVAANVASRSSLAAATLAVAFRRKAEA